MNYRKQLIVEPGSKVRLEGDRSGLPRQARDEESAQAELAKEVSRLTELQYRLYAEGKHALLVVLQGIDAAGKDGTVWHVMTAMNPQGTTVTGFKEPTPIELAHDFLWRVHQHTPGRGQVAVFNRSHYEDVLVVRVHDLVPKAVWSKRYDQINAFEKLLADSGTTIVKFFLYISPEEQLARFKQRLDDPERQWKISDSDYKERELLERLRQGLRGDARALLDRPRAVVRHPVQPQVVPQPRGVADPRRHPRRPEDEDAEADRRSRNDPQRIPHGRRRQNVTASAVSLFQAVSAWR